MNVKSSPPLSSDSVGSICVFCGSSRLAKPEYYRLAEDTGRYLADNGLRIIYGGGASGMMGHLADAALANRGEIWGITTRHIVEIEPAHSTLTQLRVPQTIHKRKQLMFDHADAFVALPGGLGTLDEIFAVVTERQLGLHDKPLLLVATDDFWTPLLAMVEAQIRAGYVQPTDRQLFSLIHRPDSILPTLRKILAAAPR